MSTRTHTFCRICEPHCPLIAEVEDGKVLALHPDLDHLSGGLACHKGLSFLQVHNDPDRVNWPMHRQNSRLQEQGDFVEVEWDSALSEIGAQLKRLKDQYGSNSIAVYMGNPWSFNATGLVMGEMFQNLIGTDMRFSANTQDSASRVSVNCEVYGSTGALMVPDLYHTDYLLCLGANPKVSRWLGASIPNDGLEAVKKIIDRGGKVRFVNPRKIESSTTETGPTLQIKPGTDVYFLAAVLHEINLNNGFDQKLLDRYGKNIETLKEFISCYPAERVDTVTGIDVNTIKTVASEIQSAKSAVVYIATGVNQSRQGVLTSWLAEMINFCTGNLGRKGGSIKPAGLVDNFPPHGETKRVETSIGSIELPDPIGFAAMPGVLLADLIEKGDIKALIVYGGNPLLSIGGGDRLRQACLNLDLMVTLDIYCSATAEVCDYILPTTDWLERMDINLLANGCQLIPYVQYTDPVVEPAHGRRNGWWVLARLAQEMGLESPLDKRPEMEDGTDIINGMLSSKGLSINSIRRTANQTVKLEENDPASVYTRCLQHPDKKIDCCPVKFIETGLLDRCHTIFAELEQEAAHTMKLISLRTPYIQNSWLSNLGRFRRGMRSKNPAFLGLDDAQRLGLHTGDPVRISSIYGSIETEVYISEDVREGAVAMSHGFGHERSFGLKVANGRPGANYNALLPTGVEGYEPLSHMSWMTGIPVNIERIIYQQIPVS